MDNALKYTHTKGLTHLKYLSDRGTHSTHAKYLFMLSVLFSVQFTLVILHRTLGQLMK